MSGIPSSLFSSTLTHFGQTLIDGYPCESSSHIGFKFKGSLFEFEVGDRAHPLKDPTWTREPHQLWPDIGVNLNVYSYIGIPLRLLLVNAVNMEFHYLGGVFLPENPPPATSAQTKFWASVHYRLQGRTIHLCSCSSSSSWRLHMSNRRSCLRVSWRPSRVGKAWSSRGN